MGPLFQSLDRLEKLIQGKDYFFGDRLTEADIRLYTTIVRPTGQAYQTRGSLLPLFTRFGLTLSTMGTSNATSVRFATTTPTSIAG